MYKERKKKYTLQNERGEEALNRNHRAYIVRLPQLNYNSCWLLACVASVSSRVLSSQRSQRTRAETLATQASWLHMHSSDN